ncbi:response regulator transcription factor [Paenibacillus sp. NEAU-GSW1]|uniref:response regulator transcription factor n=1 Tax=Paenibacillus sp. NEAU-GSW1 TaxID=2682486 RepID=UPI0012E20CAF|nr:response regulator transcription factor [Paenibacillus sp. NEAU-GSW1]MUT65641.1 response regulator [Paenibacillus sp. NEAU-GSW1]
MRILLLEDEEAIRGFVRINLKRNDMDVTEADNGETAIELADSEGPFDIALLDVMLPTISGFEVCEALRRKYPAMGIIMLTAKSQEEDKIYGLELGADDYVQKPFSPGELMARIKSLYRRMKPHTSGEAAAKRAAVDAVDVSVSTSLAAPSEQEQDQELRRGRFRLTYSDRKLWKDDKEIVLTPTEWTLVRLLMERPGKNVSRDDILTEVWGRYYVGDLKVVDVNIRRIRQKIEDNASQPAFIETVWGLGYRWNRSAGA